ncbi:UrcA family protein [uncultured Tateyamaria sp.]|uniref:UrcA family protein n=1 Tax=uncultured Tateyamaria sp. TaxID=455651 RepID=UPI00261F900D|nr:UrcA family protein [uncultured Tateyamaria sp.]
MIKSIFTAAALLATLAPAATAETRESFSVEIVYNANALTTDAVKVERSIEKQARRACIVTYTHIKRVDADCVDGIVTAALSKINETSAQADTAETLTSARLNTQAQTSLR